MVYGSETWPMRVEDIQRLQRAERMMVRWICGVTLRNRVASSDILAIHGILFLKAKKLVNLSLATCEIFVVRRKKVHICLEGPLPWPTLKSLAGMATDRHRNPLHHPYSGRM